MIHEKIKQLRIQNNISQDELARIIGISRPTLSQIELGERKLKADEVQKIASIFEISTSELLEVSKVQAPKKPENDPNAKLKNSILYILSKCGQKPNVGKILLNKLLYFSDFDHHERTGDSITGTVYLKLPRGPVPANMDAILEEMQREKRIQTVEGEFFGYKQIRIIPAQEPDMTEFTYVQIQEMDRVINRFSDMTGAQVSDFSHVDMPYRATKEIGTPISYGLVFYRDPKHYTVSDPIEYDD